MKPKNTPFTIMMVVFVIAFVIVPFFNRNKMARPGASRGTIDKLTEYSENNLLTPEELMVSLFKNHDVTFVGEPGKFHETTAFVDSLVPILVENGVTVAAVSFLNYSDQEEIDLLVTADEFDTDLADKLLFHNLVMNGYREYRDFMMSVWDYNHSLSADAPPLRLLGLNVDLDWSVIQTNEDAEDPAVIKKVYVRGVPDTFMAEVIKKEITDKGLKAMVYTGLQNALASLQVEDYQEKMRENGFPDDIQRTAWHIKQLSGVESCTVLLHAPWSVEKSQYGIDYPLGGALDTFIEKYDPLEQRMGLLTENTPFGELPTAPGSLGADESNNLSDLCDAYVLLGPINGYTPFTAIPGFINEDNFDEAVKMFPGPKEVMPQSPRELNDFISGTAANVTQILEKFEK